MKKQYSIPILLENDKYPYNCTYYQKGNKIKKTKEEIKKVIEQHLKQIKGADEIEIAFLGKSFTSIDEEKREKIFEIIKEYIDSGKVNSIRIIAKPNEINKKILKELKKYNVKTIEIEVASCNDYILKCSELNYRNKHIKKAAKLIKWKGFNLGCQMLVGLPDSTRIDETNTAKDIIKLKPKITRILPIYVFKQTKLEKEYKDKTYQPLTDKQGIEICKEIVRMFADKNIETIRIGYQELDIQENDGLITGPFNPAFKELIQIAMWYDAIVEKIKTLNVKVKEVEVTVNPVDIENVIGFKNENIIKLKKTYDVDLIVKPDEEIKRGRSKIEIVKTYNDFLEK